MSDDQMKFTAVLKSAEEHLSFSDPVLAKLIHTYGLCRISPHQDYYQALLSTIISQQLSLKAADSILKRFLALFENHLPSPAELLTIEPEAIRATGCSYAKIKYMRDLAERIVDGRLNLDEISVLANDEVIRQLTAVKGIGEWSAHMFMIFSLGRLDVLPTGDLGIRKGMMNLYGYEKLPSPQEMRETAALNNWHPYESVASWYIWRSLENTPSQ